MRISQTVGHELTCGRLRLGPSHQAKLEPFQNYSPGGWGPLLGCIGLATPFYWPLWAWEWPAKASDSHFWFVYETKVAFQDRIQASPPSWCHSHDTTHHRGWIVAMRRLGNAEVDTTTVPKIVHSSMLTSMQREGVPSLNRAPRTNTSYISKRDE